MLENFKNITHGEINFIGPFQGFIGPNGSGKSNLCQGLKLLMEGRIFQGSSNSLVTWGKEHFVLQGEYQGMMRKVWGHLKKMKLILNDQEVSQKIFHEQGGVFFLDDQAFLSFLYSPMKRRDFLDRLAYYLNHSYREKYKTYKNLLIQRNQALKKGYSSRFLETLTESYMDASLVINNTRYNIAKKLSDNLKNGEYFIYYPCYNKEKYGNLWRRFFSKEKERGFSLFGPQREDLTLMIEKKPLVSSFSLGEKKFLVIQLFLQAAQLAGGKLFILDDLDAHFDQERLKRVVKMLRESDSPIVATALKDFPVEGIPLWRLSQGKIMKEV